MPGIQCMSTMIVALRGLTSPVARRRSRKTAVSPVWSKGAYRGGEVPSFWGAELNYSTMACFDRAVVSALLPDCPVYCYFYSASVVLFFDE